MAAMDGEPVDRFPISPRIWRYAQWKNQGIFELARELDFDPNISHGGLPPGHMDPDATDMDRLLPDVRYEIRRERLEGKTLYERTIRTPDGPLHDVLIKPDPGGEYGIAPNPEWREPLCKTADDVELLRHLLPDPRFARPSIERTLVLDREVGEAGLVSFRPSPGPDHVVVDALGPEQALVASVAEPELLDRAIDIADRWHLAVMTLALEAGVKIIFDPLYNFSLSVGFSPRFYREKAAPLLRRHAELIHSHGARMFFYDDGKLAGSIGAIVEAGADIIETLTPPPAGDLDYAWLAENYGGRACFKGGIDTVRIRFGTPEEIARTVRRSVETLGATRRFILSASDSITEGTPDANIRAFFDTGRAAGRELARRLFGS